MSGTEFRRRLAAILAADAAGYSSLMAADERSTVTALDAAPERQLREHKPVRCGDQYVFNRCWRCD
jgi:class 3 adenylate cyclase